MMFKQTNTYIEGGYARCTGFGTRIYAILKINTNGTMIMKRVGDTNRGTFKFHKTKKTFLFTSKNHFWYQPVAPV
jgi:hypothetical protein